MLLLFRCVDCAECVSYFMLHSVIHADDDGSLLGYLIYLQMHYSHSPVEVDETFIASCIPLALDSSWVMFSLTLCKNNRDDFIMIECAFVCNPIMHPDLQVICM